MVTIRKTFRLEPKYLNEHRKEIETIVKQLNNLLKDKVQFSIKKDKNGNDILPVTVFEEKLKSHAGRPKGHTFDYARVEQMKAEGKTNKEIYTELGVSRALYYLRMKEYKK